ncbi:uncharacterized protein L969DRAFT_616734 [Mixia osmundae IAM 14324]|uniref:G-patch domain-containing protein n=1 Tax=Mixia osmundae (strain CBS 9802 / IAM 14324 / JCM 22182 / KY 12970) TaxID=764103 RepID=G7E636_MIXOS|nr:uncharacterized protein L969DRAFT_616734 [Mixia osmundae IAM 14324]KEI40551.1 hypothetical protein L969DRAFT_616734 [Mixia osmundae IAM 14324]GAA98296.1 hypothetical protein E5Q_04980 [Mixia osmundae IAM 14324]
MARRGKRATIDDDDPDTSSASDELVDDDDDLGQSVDRDDAEALAEYRRTTGKRKRQSRQAAQAEALYGSFLDDDAYQRPSNAASTRKLRKPQAFVAATDSHANRPLEEADAAIASRLERDAEIQILDNLAPAIVEPATLADRTATPESGSDMDDADTSEEEAKVERVREGGDEDEQPDQIRSMAGIGAARPGFAPPPSLASGVPFSFGKTDDAQRQRRSFLGAQPSSNPTISKPSFVSREEQKHFAQLENQGGIGFKLLQRMGWSNGSGLGQSGAGIITPIEVKKRPEKMGISFDGFSERTKQSKDEARRRGEAVSDEENSPTSRKHARSRKAATITAAPKAADRAEAWKKPQRSKKNRIEHRTYDEILKSAGQSEQDTGIGQIVDLSGNALPSLSSLSMDVPVPTADTTRLPELRHNLRLIIETNKSELDHLAREALNVDQQRKWNLREATKAREAADSEAKRVSRLQQILEIVSEVETISKTATQDRQTLAERADLFADAFERLAGGYHAELSEYRLDELVVGALAPLLRIAWSEWEPLVQPVLGIAELKRWRSLLGVDAHSVTDAQGDARTMTAYETLIWTLWLPKVRSAINNHWQPQDAGPAASFYLTWQAVLPEFIKGNVLEQLILPKLSKAVHDWTPSSSVSLHDMLLPWLEQGDDRMGDLLVEAKRQVAQWLKSWKPRDKVPAGLSIWQEILSKDEWDTLLLKHVVPRLSASLRDSFRINPGKQDLVPLDRVMAWQKLLRSSMLAQILEAEFFPKWLDALFVWLTHDKVNFDEVASWFKWWKASYFSNEVTSLRRVSSGFARGVDLMNKALALGEDAPYKLQRPDTRPLPSRRDSVQAEKAAKASAVKTQSAMAEEITFREVLEDFLASKDLVMVPTGRSHEKTGQQLFRVSASVDGKAGTTVYVYDDVVFAHSKEGEWKPTGIEELASSVLSSK